MWSLIEEPYPLNPQNLSADPGVERVYLEWEGAIQPNRVSRNSLINQTSLEENIEQRQV